METARNVVIIGGGPSGLTAAIYTARANLAPLMFEGVALGSEMPGGQLMLTTEVENFPGFPEGRLGPELIADMRKQAVRFGTEIRTENVTAVDLETRPFVVTTSEGSVAARTLIVSTGAKARLLGLPEEIRLIGKGVSTCATCDGFFHRGKEIAVVGGGDSALEEALFLTRFASKVTLIHRRDKLRASKVMQDRANANPRIAFEWDSVVERLLEAPGPDGTSVLFTGIRLRNLKTGATKETPLSGLFVAIGHDPNTSLFRGKLSLDPSGYIVTGKGTETSVPGVFACGDVVDHVYRQAITAAGTGCMAAIDAERHLERSESVQAGDAAAHVRGRSA